ncbi:PREDICTED: uncharacterized protein LOC109220725 [Nicotiana attenuata]|uniref:uncharacterized protein LOC109220725 n=1 Tax=Nicotiana attenuata TaxID=49451 RepID=UPI0009053B86|nr:PREDICTED: uncharacterized protein LOC109220725 [Nicotiana attenuata]
MIEEQAYLYDDIQSLFEATPMMVNLLVKKDAPSAKEYLKASKKLTTGELDLLNLFHQYTLEGIIIYIFGCLFNSINESPAVRLSTLVDQLLLSERNYQRVGSKPSVNVIPGVNKTVKGGKTEEGGKTEKGAKRKYYKQKPIYVICNFDLSILPIQLSLPMVYPPKEWGVVERLKVRGEAPKSLSDITGDYLSEPNGDLYLYNRYNLLTSRDKNNFNILLGENYQEMCDTMNTLQKEAFEINVGVLDFIRINYDILVEIDLLMPKFLANLNVAEGCKLLRECYLEASKGVGKLKPNLYPAFLKEFLSDIQRARYERFILDIASAYEGYEFYLPAFVDFRGRIYRAGVLHFHERDLARSLIVFSKRTVYDAKMANPSHSTEYDEKVKTMLYAAASFHYQKFDTYSAAERWYHEQRFESIGRIIEYAPTARDPFQFLSKALIIQGLDTRVSDWQLPITQDASASAYQIISYSC